MARSTITNPKTLAALAEQIGQPVVKAFARGGTDHRIDACLVDGTITYVYKDGRIEASSDRWAQGAGR